MSDGVALVGVSDGGKQGNGEAMTPPPPPPLHPFSPLIFKYKKKLDGY